MPEALPAFHADVRKAFAVDGQQVAIEQPLLGRLIVTELAFMHLSGWRRRRLRELLRLRWLLLLGLGLSVVVLQSVGEQRRLLVELFAARVALKRRLAAERVHLHVVVQAGLLVGGVVAVRALVLFPRQDVLVVVLGVALEETSRLELLAAQHAGVDSQRLAVRANDDG